MTFGIEESSPALGAGRAPEASLAGEAFTLESRGWTAIHERCDAKEAAVASLLNLAAPDPIASVSYKSQGNALIVAGVESALARACAARLAGSLHVTLLDASAAPADGAFALWSGRIESLEGYLGEFTAAIAGLHAPGAAPRAGTASARFDLVLDFSQPALLGMRQPPQGYFRAPADPAALDALLADMEQAVGEFEKPRYFAYRENVCAHSRSEVPGCSACIEICSTQAIASEGDHVKVDPHLCMGCGACASVCPTGAMTYQYPRVPERGAQLKQLLSTYRHAGGRDACIVFHNGHDGRALLETAASTGRGLPARALPLEAWHVAAVGLDLLLPAVAFGASQVVIVSAGSEDREYLAATRAQMAIGEAILQGLGYEGTHFALVEAREPRALESAFDALTPAPAVPVPATFLLSADKRTSIEFAIDHLLRHAPRPVDEIALPAGSPYGEVRVDQGKCTLCLACAGACPASALMDGRDRPLLQFIERNCVQCGLCEATCPEDAITLSPRLLLGAPAREARALNEAQPFHCVRCDKPFGTRQMVEAMLGRLAGHSMFTGGEALRRLQMCADCRVVDMMSNKSEASVLKLGADS